MEVCAREFYAVSKFLKSFQIERFCQFWEQALTSHIGVIYLQQEAGQVTGAIGGVLYPDLYSGELVATEFFWFVRPGCRGGGIRLYKAFEAWARFMECKQIRMVHLMDSMPDQLARLYARLGYQPAETHYTKDLT